MPFRGSITARRHGSGGRPHAMPLHQPFQFFIKACDGMPTDRKEKAWLHWHFSLRRELHHGAIAIRNRNKRKAPTFETYPVAPGHQ